MPPIFLIMQYPVGPLPGPGGGPVPPGRTEAQVRPGVEDALPALTTRSHRHECETALTRDTAIFTPQDHDSGRSPTWKTGRAR
ncbi:hypothetical protein GCM10010423_45840 [Streptomyces levis]|uniref:Uncharacterized protein n=1 Tax=Streptomyces levis TaxID=285566 RepID=A0ABN3P0M1_9ACTN